VLLLLLPLPLRQVMLLYLPLLVLGRLFQLGRHALAELQLQLGTPAAAAAAAALVAAAVEAAALQLHPSGQQVAAQQLLLPVQQ
jgi:hypothetical protein